MILSPDRVISFLKGFQTAAGFGLLYLNLTLFCLLIGIALPDINFLIFNPYFIAGSLVLYLSVLAGGAFWKFWHRRQYTYYADLSGQHEDPEHSFFRNISFPFNMFILFTALYSLYFGTVYVYSIDRVQKANAQIYQWKADLREGRRKFLERYPQENLKLAIHEARFFAGQAKTVADDLARVQNELVELGAGKGATGSSPESGESAARIEELRERERQLQKEQERISESYEKYKTRYVYIQAAEDIIRREQAIAAATEAKREMERDFSKNVHQYAVVRREVERHESQLQALLREKAEEERKLGVRRARLKEQRKTEKEIDQDDEVVALRNRIRKLTDEIEKLRGQLAEKRRTEAREKSKDQAAWIKVKRLEDAGHTLDAIVASYETRLKPQPIAGNDGRNSGSEAGAEEIADAGSASGSNPGGDASSLSEKDVERFVELKKKVARLEQENGELAKEKQEKEKAIVTLKEQLSDPQLAAKLEEYPGLKEKEKEREKLEKQKQELDQSLAQARADLDKARAKFVAEEKVKAAIDQNLDNQERIDSVLAEGPAAGQVRRLRQEQARLKQELERIRQNNRGSLAVRDLEVKQARESIQDIIRIEVRNVIARGSYDNVNRGSGTQQRSPRNAGEATLIAVSGGTNFQMAELVAHLQCDGMAADITAVSRSRVSLRGLTFSYTYDQLKVSRESRCLFWFSMKKDPKIGIQMSPPGGAKKTSRHSFLVADVLR